MTRLAKSLSCGLFAGACCLWFSLPYYGTKRILPGLAQGTPAGVVPENPSYELVSFTARGGVRIEAEYASALTNDGLPLPHPEDHPSLLYFYGAGRTLATNQSQIRYFRTMGVNVLMPDLPGYGMSGGIPSEPAFAAAAEAAYEYLGSRTPGGAPAILVGGSSLGTGTAIDLASRRKVAGLISLSGPTSVWALGYSSYPHVPPALVRYVLRDVPFNNLAAIRKVSAPILIIQGTADTRVPPDMADQLAAAATARVTLIKVPGAGHDDIGKVGGAALWTRIHDWLAAPHS